MIFLLVIVLDGLDEFVVIMTEWERNLKVPVFQTTHLLIGFYILCEKEYRTMHKVEVEHRA